MHGNPEPSARSVTVFLHKPTKSSKQHRVQDKPLGWLARKEANLVLACRKPETDQKRQDETNRLHGIATRADMN